MRRTFTERGVEIAIFVWAAVVMMLAHFFGG
jgi:hypothetical protein